MEKQAWLQALAGPVVLGGVLGVPLGAGALLQEAAQLPLVLFGTSLLMIPALYIGATILGVAPSAPVVAKAMSRGFSACGALLLGLAPLCAFLLATTTGVELILLLGMGAVTTSVLVGLRAIAEVMFDGQERRHVWVPLFASWALVSLLVGERLFSKSIHAITSL